MPATDLISRGLANKLTNRLFQISSLVQLGDKELALKSIDDMAKFLNRFVETRDDEQSRAKRDESQS